jgi:hypothetical protein
MAALKLPAGQGRWAWAMRRGATGFSDTEVLRLSECDPVADEHASRLYDARVDSQGQRFHRLGLAAALNRLTHNHSIARLKAATPRLERS